MASDIQKGKHLHFLDNLRTIIIFFVVVVHTSGLYLAGDTWEWFWIVDDPANNDLSGLIFLVLDIFLMTTLFLISGYLAPASLRTKSDGQFIWRKFRRLIIPWLTAVLTLIPLYKVIFLYARGLPQQNWTTYFHITNPNSQNWLWFLPVLFVFNLLYLLLTKVKIKLPQISLRAAALGVFIIGFGYSVGMDLLGFSGWTLTPLLDFQNERILIYVMFFLLGVLGYQLKIFDQKPQRLAGYVTVGLTAWVPIGAYLIFLLYPLFAGPGSTIISPTVDSLITWFAFQLTLFSMVYLMVQTFWRYADRTGPIWQELNRNSYGVYMIHVIVLGVIGLWMVPFGIPSLLKHLLLIVATYVVSNVLVSLYRRLTTLQRVPLQPELVGGRR